MKEMQLTADMLREAFQQTQREILEVEAPERYQARWERMAELLNEKIAGEHVSLKMQENTEKHQ